MSAVERILRASTISTPCTRRSASTADVTLYSTSIVHGLPGSYGCDGLEVLQRPLRAVLDQLARAKRRDLPRRVAADAFLDGDRRQASAEQLRSFFARRAVAGHEQHGHAPCSAERGVDPRLADERAVEPEVLPLLPGDGVVEHAVRRAVHRVHADEERGVAARLEERRVLGPLLLHDELAVGVEQVGHERVERPAAAGAVAIHDDDLGRPRRFRAAHGRVDLLGVEAPALLVHRVAAARLLPLDDAGDAFHVADDVDLHGCSLSNRGHRPRRQARPRDRCVGRDRRRVRARVRGRGRLASSSTTGADATARKRSPPRSAASSFGADLDGRGRGRRVVRRRRSARRLRRGRRRVAARRRSRVGAAARALGGDAAREPDVARSSRRAAFSARSPSAATARSSSSARPPGASARPGTPTTRRRRRRSSG